MIFLHVLLATQIILCDYHYTKFHPGNRWCILHFLVDESTASTYEVGQQHQISSKPTSSYFSSCQQTLTFL